MKNKDTVLPTALFSMVQHDDDHFGMEDDNFLPLPLNMQTKVRFPPGCTVLACCYDGQLLLGDSLPEAAALCVSSIITGRVVSVGINLAKNSRRETLFKVERVRSLGGRVEFSAIFYAHEEALQFALGCPVWFTCKGKTLQWEKATVIGSEHQPLMEDLSLIALSLTRDIFYTIQMPNGGVCHGILPDHLIYRSPDKQLKWQKTKVVAVKAEKSTSGSTILIEVTPEKQDIVKQELTSQGAFVKAETQASDDQRRDDEQSIQSPPIIESANSTPFSEKDYKVDFQVDIHGADSS